MAMSRWLLVVIFFLTYNYFNPILKYDSLGVYSHGHPHLKAVTPVVLLVPSNCDCEGRVAPSNFSLTLKKNGVYLPLPRPPYCYELGPAVLYRHSCQEERGPGKVRRIRAVIA